MIGGILIVATILVVGALLSSRRARRRDQEIYAMHARAGQDGASDSFGGFQFFGSDTSSDIHHHHPDHYPGDPTGDWSSGSDGGASGGGGASGSFDGAGASDGGGGGDGDGGGGGGD